MLANNLTGVAHVYSSSRAAQVFFIKHLLEHVRKYVHQ